MTDGLGLWLRRARETHQLSLADAERALHIRRRYLEAMEVGDYTALPGKIQARGFLRNYARYLGLPVEEVLARYDAEVQGHPVQPRNYTPPQEVRVRAVAERPSNFAPPPSEEEERATVRPVQIPTMLLLVGVLVVCGIFAIGASFALPLLSEVWPASHTPATLVVATPTPESVLPVSGTLVAPMFAPAPDGHIRVRLVANAHAWIRVSVDDYIGFEGNAAPGQSLEYDATQLIAIKTGNGEAFQLFVNGADWGPLGAPGDIIDREWNPQGELILETP